jgi:pyridoxal phosphate-dependent aminotransferase EpsN
MERILLSPPDVGGNEREALLRAFDTGWIAPAGPELDAFEHELAQRTSQPAAVALASGTAALHLALAVCGVGPGDEVVVQTATFAASAFAVVHAGARPVFCDVERATWCLDPDLLDELLAARHAAGRLPAAVMAVDLYGLCPDYGRLLEVCDRYGVAVVEDAAEALGSVSGGRPAGSFGRVAALSFNGNKILTTSGGGALLGPVDLVTRARHLATQARQPVVHYEHAEVGFNYRLSNLLAALGRAQLAGLEERIARREHIARRYRRALPELAWAPDGLTERPNRWLNVGLLPPGVDPVAVCEKLAADDIEARPAWKPMHAQPVFAHAERVGGAVADELFARGLCLPSGSSLTEAQQARVIDAVRRAVEL